MTTLLQIAKLKHSVSDETKCFSKVLSIYILSALFKDTRIGEDVLLFAQDALILAMDGFDSTYWNVRNASTLLFSSLMTRIFGIKFSFNFDG